MSTSYRLQMCFCLVNQFQSVSRDNSHQFLQNPAKCFKKIKSLIDEMVPYQLNWWGLGSIHHYQNYHFHNLSCFDLFFQNIWPKVCWVGQYILRDSAEGSIEKYSVLQLCAQCQEIGCRISVRPCEYMHLIKQKKHSQENLKVLTDQNKSTYRATL